MMKKILVYHLYCGKDFSENMANKVHFMCLSKYIKVFDEIRFTISVDDLSDRDTIADGLQWILSLNHNGVKNFRIVKNTELYEVETFKTEILEGYENLDGYVFFAHNKGTMNMKNPQVNGETIFRWVCGMYFYNFEFLNEVEGYFNGNLRASEVFYGTFLTQFPKYRTNVCHAMPNNISGLEYSGTFYWINMPKYKNCRMVGTVKDVEPDSRYFAEEYPGMWFERYAYGCGMTSHNDAILDATNLNLYYADDKKWDEVLAILGEADRFKEFLNEIRKKI